MIHKFHAARSCFGALCLILALGAGQARAQTKPQAKPVWGFETSDVNVDPAFHFGRLVNGMRYIIVPNATPKGVVMVRMQIAAGSLDETDAERGLAHFVEHMAFEGSTHVPEAAMVPLLQRLGLAFGADTNAFTGQETTTYVLDLPKNDPKLLDTALMLMRETASELTFAPDAIARERGVVLAEKRDRDSWSYRASLEQQAFFEPRARYALRMPIGETNVIEGATPAQLRGFWAREYVPGKAVLVVVGDVDLGATEAAIRSHFADWEPNAAVLASPPQPGAGPITYDDAGRTDVYLDPALPERITISLKGPYQSEADSQTQRQTWMLRRVGYGVINRRLQHLARGPKPSFRDAAFFGNDIFKAGRSSSLVIDAVSGQWRAAITDAALTWRRAMTEGFTSAEVAEQLANIREQEEHGAASADTRANAAFMNQAFGLVHDQHIPSPPADNLSRFNAFAPQITPQKVLEALKYEALDFAAQAPLIRFEDRIAPDGGAAAVRAAWDAAMKAPLPATADTGIAAFAYTHFDAVGRVVADTREPLLGIRTLRFANGVRLNIRHTDLAKDQVLVTLALDGGEMLNTNENPLATAMVGVLANGGLGKHSQDEMQTLLAGHRISASLTAGADVFAMGGATTPADLPLQLQVMTALITDPGYRQEGEQQYRLAVNNWFQQLRATPSSALGAGIGGILSDQTPRFTLQPQHAYQALSYAKLKHDITDRLVHGAIEIGMVGDMDEDKAIALVASTLGALPAREAEFQPYTDLRRRPFTQDHTPHTLRHTGPANQALIEDIWLTRDDADPVDNIELSLLGQIETIQLTDGLREKLGKAYSPGASSQTSRVFREYGTFAISASVDVKDLAVTRAAIADSVAALRDHPVSDDLLLRARAPLVDGLDNALKTNSGWLGLVARAASQPDRIERLTKAKARLLAVTPAQLQAEAKHYLADGAMVDIAALPEVPPPPPSH